MWYVSSIMRSEDDGPYTKLRAVKCHLVDAWRIKHIVELTNFETGYVESFSDDGVEFIEFFKSILQHKPIGCVDCRGGPGISNEMLLMEVDYPSAKFDSLIKSFCSIQTSVPAIQELVGKQQDWVTAWGYSHKIWEWRSRQCNIRYCFTQFQIACYLCDNFLDNAFYVRSLFHTDTYVLYFRDVEQARRLVLKARALGINPVSEAGKIRFTHRGKL